MKKILTVVFCLFFFFTLVFSPINAQENGVQVSEGQINEAIAKTVPLRFLPNSSFYFFISIKEILSRTFQPSSAKRAEFDEILAQKRLKEGFLLIKSGDLAGGKRALLRYEEQLKKMQENLDKARSQNQDVTVIVSETAEDFKNHEIFLAALKTRYSKEGVDDAIKAAIDSFQGAIFYINNISPGVKNRFKILPSEESSIESSPAASVEVEEQTPFPSTNPKRVIY